ncbi:protein translocase subunit SecF [bacterium]|nr:protein translocase subunit SecF [bacterium]
MNIRPILEWNIIGKSKGFLSISGIMVLISLLIMLFNTFFSPMKSPLNFGIDFTGGVLMNLDFEKEVQESKIREVLSTFNQANATIQLDQRNKKHAMIRLSDVTNKDEIVNTLEKELGKINKDTQSIDVIGPVIGAELRKNAILTVSLALLLILIYVAFRFHWKHGLAGILALLHDTIIALGVVSLFRIQINTPAVAAVLSIVAYSLQDTIVILDRLRENIKYRKGNQTFAQIANKSVTESWTRSFNTSFTTVLGIAALTIFAGASLLDFCIILLVGMLVGTYSSIYIVVPIVVLWEKKEEQSMNGILTPALSVATGNGSKYKAVSNSSYNPEKKSEPDKTVVIKKKKTTRRR